MKKFKQTKLNKQKILISAKKHIVFDGWSKKIIESISLDLRIKENEIYKIFPPGYLDILKFYFKETEKNMIKETKNKINLISLRTHERIYEIILLRLKININDQELIRKTLVFLSKPKHNRLGLKYLYKTVDNIWYLAGDNSTNFNFYTKRIILASIYSATVLYWLNDNSENKINTNNFLLARLKNTSIFSKVKDTLSSIFKNIPKNKFNL